MPLTFKASSSSKTEISPGLYPATCDIIADLGIQPGSGLFDPKRQLYIRFEIPSTRTNGRKGSGPAVIGRTFTASVHRKSGLRGFIEAWLGATFSDDREAERFDMETLLGKVCLLRIVESHKDDKTYSNIDAISPLPKGMQAPSPEIEPILYSGDDTAAYRRLPEWLQKKIVGQLKEATHSDLVPDRKSLEVTDDDIPF